MTAAHNKSEATGRHQGPDPAVLELVSELAERCENGDALSTRAVAVSTILAEIGADAVTVRAAAVFPFFEAGLIDATEVRKRFDTGIARLLTALHELADFGVPAGWDPATGLSGARSEALRKMLLAVVADIRVVLIKLADHLDRLRGLKRGNAEERRRAALEAREIYAPLASRLGIWHLKWELEDLAFRFLEPDTYQQIASWLNERRSDREAYIENMSGLLGRKLEDAGIAAEIQGRPKHIYSIWRKMKTKDVAFEHVFDVRAIRVMTESVADCYAVLGIVHGEWPPIPGEFDDYIATPKENFYRSLHTAVIGPEGKTLEIQVRTDEMHRHAELGVAAHWTYKEGRKASKAYLKKINWLRQLIEPGTTANDDFIERFRAEVFEERIYVFTPQGDIMELPIGATPLDFAYHIHTDLGHRCRGARVNGRMVPLTHKLAHGDQVEVITQRNSTPSRDWLMPQLGYLVSNRARSKVRQWLRRQDRDHALEQGHVVVDKELERLGVVPQSSVNQLAKHLRFESPTELYIAVGSGDLSLAQIAASIQARHTPVQEPPVEIRRRTRPKKGDSTSSVEIEGVGDLLTNFAGCCKPVPPDPISGFITRGRGVTIHRNDCGNLLRLEKKSPERIIAVDWRRDSTATFPVDIHIEAYDRRNLVKDITTLLATEKVNIVGLTTATDRSTNSADIDLTVEVVGLSELSRILQRISQIQNVVRVRRKN